jgi:hypothetical protein
VEDFVLPEDLTVLSAAELSALLESARNFAAAITDALADPELADTADLDALEALAGHVEAIVAAQAVLASLALERTERAATLAARIAPVEDTVNEDGEEEDPTVQAADKTQTGDVVAEAEAIVETAPEPVVAAVVHNVTSLPAPRSVAAVAPKPKANKTPARSVAIVAAAGVSGLRAGQEATLMDFVKPAVSRWESYQGYNGRQQDELFSLKAPARDPRLVANGHNDQDVIDFAVNQSRLAPLPNAPAGATGLVAAGGWCAPGEQRFEICTLAELDGILDVPTISMPRGSISYFRQLDYGTVATAIAAGEFTYTNAQLLVTSPVQVKPCFEIPCQTPVTATLDVVGLCLRAGLLQQKAFPELIEAWMRLALIAFAHYRNARNIAQIVAGSTPLTVTATFGAHAALVDAIALHGANYRFDNGMAIDATLEVVFPWWIKSVLFVEQERRQFDSEMAADWESDLAELNVRVQYVKDYQDSGFAGAGAVTSWPTSVEFLLYASGAWLRGSEDVITVHSLVDSTLLQTNRTQLLFIEAADVMLPACGPSFRISTPICPSGATAGPIAATPGTYTCSV